MAYAWARIALPHKKDEEGIFRPNIKMPGDRVSASDFDAEEEYNNLVNEGVIRDEKFPEGVNTGESVKTALIRKANAEYEAAVAGRTTQTNPGDEEATDEGTEQGQQRQKQPWER